MYNYNYNEVLNLVGYNIGHLPNIVKRQYDKGMAKYGESLNQYQGSISDILNHADEEIVDLLMYLVEAADRQSMLGDVRPLLASLVTIYKVTHEKIRTKKTVLRVSAGQ